MTEVRQKKTAEGKPALTRKQAIWRIAIFWFGWALGLPFILVSVRLTGGGFGSDGSIVGSWLFSQLAAPGALITCILASNQNTPWYRQDARKWPLLCAYLLIGLHGLVLNLTFLLEPVWPENSILDILQTMQWIGAALASAAVWAIARVYFENR